MTTWNKQTSTILAQKSVVVLSFEGKIPRALKRFVIYVNCCDFFYAEDFVGRIGIMLNFTPLRSPDIFITMPQEARKGKSWGGTSMRASKRTLWVFTACKQMKNRGAKCAFILVVVRPMAVQSSFNTEFLSSIRFSPLRLLRRRKRTRNFLAFSSEELKLSLSTKNAN